MGPHDDKCDCGLPAMQTYTIEIRTQFYGTADEMESEVKRLEEVTGGLTSTVFDEEWEEV